MVTYHFYCFFRNSACREYSGKVSKKVIGSFDSWGIALKCKVLLCEPKITLRNLRGGNALATIVSMPTKQLLGLGHLKGNTCTPNKPPNKSARALDRILFWIVRIPCTDMMLFSCMYIISVTIIFHYRTTACLKLLSQTETWHLWI